MSGHPKFMISPLNLVISPASLFSPTALPFPHSLSPQTWQSSEFSHSSLKFHSINHEALSTLLFRCLSNCPFSQFPLWLLMPRPLLPPIHPDDSTLQSPIGLTNCNSLSFTVTGLILFIVSYPKKLQSLLIANKIKFKITVQQTRPFSIT